MVATASTPTADRRTNPFNLWLVIARILALMTFAQAIFAGMLLSGYPVGRDAHRINAYALFFLSIVVLAAATLTLRRSAAGRRLIGVMATFAVGLVGVAILGVLSREGYRLHWLHLPAGVAMMGFAGAVQRAAGSLRPTPET